MYLMQNRIEVTSHEHLDTLKQRFAQAPQSMAQVPGFISFRLLEAEDGSHVIAETVFETKEHFLAWLNSEHFQKAHGGRRSNAKEPKNGYHVIIRS